MVFIRQHKTPIFGGHQVPRRKRGAVDEHPADQPEPVGRARGHQEADLRGPQLVFCRRGRPESFVSIASRHGHGRGGGRGEGTARGQKEERLAKPFRRKNTYFFGKYK